MQSHNSSRHITLSHNGIHTAQSILLSRLVKIKLPCQACYVYPHHHVKMHVPEQLPIPVNFYVTEWQHNIHPIGICKGQSHLRITGGARGRDVSRYEEHVGRLPSLQLELEMLH